MLLLCLQWIASLAPNNASLVLGGQALSRGPLGGDLCVGNRDGWDQSNEHEH